MSTVPKADTPPPANNAKTLTLQSDPNLYVRPTAGGNASGDAHATPGGVPTASAYTPPAPASPGEGGTQVGSDMGHRRRRRPRWRHNMSTVPSDKMPAPDHQPDLGGKQQPMTGKGHVDLRIPSGPGVTGPKPDVPKLGK